MTPSLRSQTYAKAQSCEEPRENGLVDGREDGAGRSDRRRGADRPSRRVRAGHGIWRMESLGVCRGTGARATAVSARQGGEGEEQRRCLLQREATAGEEGEATGGAVLQIGDRSARW